MRKASKNVVGRVVMTVVMGLLIFSFGIFGIGSWLTGAGVGSLAKVGSTSISVEAYRAAFASELQRLSNQARRNITNEQARAAGLDRQVLERLVSEAALEEEAKKLGLNVTDELVVKTLANNPAFKGTDGQFNRALFTNYARQNQLSDAGMIALQKQQTLRQEVVEGFAGGVAAPRILIDAINRQINEERAISYVIVPTTAVERFAPPDDATLMSFYTERKSDFRAPEYRKINILTAAPEDFAGDVALSDDDLRNAYDDAVTAGKLGKPERRTLQQIVYNTPEEANAAAEKLQKGASFADLLGEKQIKPEDVTLADKTKADLVDPVIADAAFKLREGETSPPIAGSFGYTIVHVVSVQPGSVVPFEAAKDSLQAEARARKVKGSSDIQAKLDGLHDKVEDLRGSGKTLLEVASALSLKLVTLDFIDQNGNDKDGKPATVPERSTTLPAAFSTTVGADTEVLRSNAGGYVWYEVTAIEAAHDRPFEEVKAKLVTAWIAEETSTKVADIANDMLKKLEGGMTLEQVAETLKSRVETANGLTRAGGSPQAALLGASLLTQIFVTPVDSYGQARAAKGSDRILFKVSDARVPPVDPASATQKTLKQRIDAVYAEDIAQQYVRKIQTDLGTTVDERLLGLAVGSN
ncbi:MAG: SurA N-terminal domain-containing protein [Beijerinckiaceae bacterium]|nr:SurA N-terminal domain-containing protein [Beijerinckiaceae bacterium]